MPISRQRRPARDVHRGQSTAISQGHGAKAVRMVCACDALERLGAAFRVCVIRCPFARVEKATRCLVVGASSG